MVLFVTFSASFHFWFPKVFCSCDLCDLRNPWAPWVPTFQASLNAPNRGAFLGVGFPQSVSEGLWVLWGPAYTFGSARLVLYKIRRGSWQHQKWAQTVQKYPKILLYIGEQDIPKHHLSSSLQSLSDLEDKLNMKWQPRHHSHGNQFLSIFALFNVQVCAGQTNLCKWRHEMKASKWSINQWISMILTLKS